jgi:hypothetical protein
MKKILTQKEANIIRHLHSTGTKQVDLAAKYEVDKRTVSKIVNNKIYTEDTTPFVWGEVDWSMAQHKPYSSDYTSPYDSGDKMRRNQFSALLNRIELLEHIMAAFEHKYNTKSSDLKAKMVEMPYNKEIREWYEAVLEHEKLIDTYYHKFK